MLRIIYAILAAMIIMISFTGCGADTVQSVQVPAQPVNSTQPSIEKVVTLESGSQETPGSTQAESTPSLTTAQLIQRAAENIQAITGRTGRNYTAGKMTTAPNASNFKVMEISDEQGTTYLINPETGQVVEFTVEQAYLSVDPSKTKTQAELNAQAESIAKATVKSFEKRREGLTFNGGSKGGENYFFRWEDPATDVGGMPALVQIGLKPDGQVFGYMNTLDLLK